jgi:hypothetical protein
MAADGGVPMPYTDTSRLEPYMLKENDLVLLGLNGGQDYVPLRVLARIEVPYLYDTVAEGLLPSGIPASTSANGITGLGSSFVSPLQLSSALLPGKPEDVFDISKHPGYVYQAFYGIDPPPLRVYFQQPYNTDQLKLPIIGYQPSYPQEGFRDGFLSPLERPHEKTQFFVLPGLSIALGFANILPEPVFPLINFWINALTIGVITDARLVYDMITKPGLAKIRTVGGLQNVSYSVQDHYGINPVSLTMTMDEIAKALA